MKCANINLLMSIVSTALLASSCSMKDPTQAYQINVKMPNASSAKNAFHSNSITPRTFIPTPTPSLSTATTTAGFRCFALNVLGSGISADSRFGCTDGSMGQMIGLADISGGTVSGDVLAGPARTIQLIGVQVDATSAIQGCPTFDQIFSAAADPKHALDGVNAYNLGEATIDVFADSVVSITANFSSPPQMFQGCGGSSSGPGSSTSGALSLWFSPSYPNLPLQPAVLYNTPNPGTFYASGGKAPYTYTYGISSGGTGTLTPSSDTTSAVFMPPSIAVSPAPLLTMTVTDSAGATAVQTVAISGTGSQLKVVGPFAAQSGACIPLQLISSDMNGNPAVAIAGMTATMLMDNGGGGSYYSDSSCSTSINISSYPPGVAAGSVIGAFGPLSTVFYKNTTAASVSFNPTYIGNGYLNFSGPPAQYLFQDWNSAGTVPNVIGRNQCLSVPIQLLLEASTGTLASPQFSSDANARTVTVTGSDSSTQFFYDSGCLNPLSTINLNPFQASTGGYYLKTNNPGSSTTWHVLDQYGLGGSISMSVVSPTPTPVPTPVAQVISADYKDMTDIYLNFSEVMNSSALIAGNYSVVSVNNVYPLSGLTISPISGGQYVLNWASGVVCQSDTFTVNNVSDLAGNAIPVGYNSTRLSAISATPPYVPTAVSATSGTGTNTPTFTISSGYFSPGDRVKFFSDATCTTPSPLGITISFPTSGSTFFTSGTSGVLGTGTYTLYLQTVSACGDISTCSPAFTLTW